MEVNFVKKKTGRPIIDEKKDMSVGFRLSKKKRQALLEYASKNNLSISQTVNKALDLLFMEK
jgi:hypothetical protein